MLFLTTMSAVLVTSSLGASIGASSKSCSAPRDRGDFCSSNQQSQMFYFNSQQNICQPFMYNGCNGNGNRFSSAGECQDYCINGAGAQMMRDQPAGSNPDIQSMAQACNADYDNSHLNITRCTTNQCPNGHSCNNGFCCPTADYLCNLNYDAGKFSVGGEKSDRYFFTKQYNTCMRFSYYGTLGNANNFPNYNACMRMCGSQRV